MNHLQRYVVKIIKTSENNEISLIRKNVYKNINTKLQKVKGLLMCSETFCLKLSAV